MVHPRLTVVCVLTFLCLVADARRFIKPGHYKPKVTLSAKPSPSPSPSPSPALCRTDFNRNQADPINYVLVCKCRDTTDDDFDVLARVQVNDTKTGGDMVAAQVAATVRCMQGLKSTLLHLCIDDATSFFSDGRKAVEKCLEEKPNEEEKQLKGEFKFDDSTCKVEPRVLLEPKRTLVAWLCLSPQDTFRVSPARTDVTIKGKRRLARKAARFIKKCANPSEKFLVDFCRRKPTFFERIGDLRLWRCCLRARWISGLKIQCISKSFSKNKRRGYSRW